MSDITSFSIKIERIIATIMIFLCHTVFLFGETIGLSAQFFNIGVDVFLMISAYLFSFKKNCDFKMFDWYKKRFFRIAIPYYILLLFIVVYYFFFGINFKISDYIGYYVFSQGLTENYLPGLSHLWYITAIMLAYIITPFLYKIREVKNIIIWLFVVCLALIYGILAIFAKPIYGTIYFCIFEYILFFLIFSEKINISKKSKWNIVVVSFFLVMLFCVLKLVSNILFDGTDLYTHFLVPIVDMFVGISIFAFIFNISKLVYPALSSNKIAINLINHLDSVSFEFYLIHYILITGPVNLVLQLNPLLNFVLILLASYAFSLLLHFVSKKTFNVIKNKLKL